MLFSDKKNAVDHTDSHVAVSRKLIKKNQKKISRSDNLMYAGIALGKRFLGSDLHFQMAKRIFLCEEAS